MTLIGQSLQLVCDSARIRRGLSTSLANPMQPLARVSDLLIRVLSCIKRAQVQLGEPLRVAQNVDLNDPAASSSYGAD